MTNEEYFPKTISQWEFAYKFTCLQIYRELLPLAIFLWVHSNSKEVSYFSWQNTYPNLKSTCHFKLRFFMWTKLLENLVLVKYLISVAAALIIELTNISYQFILIFSMKLSKFLSVTTNPYFETFATPYPLNFSEIFLIFP